ncbi:MAG: ribulose-phosphate 3-epimerase [Athalassotoga sp.]|uniref:ribulose-phosphate 3-epimerase n=1 Tax=Athalassotoga sp. TaxID=2022597 RepID=UPI003D078DCD
MKRNVKLSPSVLSADFTKLGEEIKKVEPLSDYIHLDVMDGHFVPNITYGLIIGEAIKRVTNVPIDTHLMIENPEMFVDDFCEISDIVSVHYESTRHLNRMINRIKDHDKKAFVAINPHTIVELIKDVIMDIDGVLVMSVNPGFGGQKFIPNTLNKIRSLDEMRKELGLTFEIEIDGGINEETFKSVIKAGADIIVTGNYAFSAEDPLEALRKIKEFVPD